MPITIKFGVEEYTIGPHMHAKFGSDWGRWMGTGAHKVNKSPLPRTDPRDAEAQCMLNIPYRVI